ncbi:MAG: AEC family transporter, partial [Dorea sp.]|nr:AEC family transporter [Dorea sp.]
LISVIIPKVLRVEKKQSGTYMVMTIFSNIGFMGYPIVAALYGSGAVLLASLFAIPYNILIYSFGVALMSQDENASLKDYLSIKKIINIGFVASMITLVIVIFQIHVPAVIGTTVQHLGNMAVPLSMLVIGTSLAKMEMKELFTDFKLIAFSLIRLIVMPLIFVAVIRQFVTNPVILGVCMIELAVPVGSMVALLAKEYDGDAMLAAKSVTLTTVLSVVTIPIVAMLTGL